MVARLPSPQLSVNQKMAARANSFWVATGYGVRMKQQARLFIREWRKHRGLTQQRLADRLGVDKGTISKLENGKMPWDQKYILGIAEALGIEPASLFMRDPSQPDYAWTLWEQAKKLSPEEARKASEMIRIMSGNTPEKNSA